MAPITGLCFDGATNGSGWGEERGGNYMYVGRRKEWRWERGRKYDARKRDSVLSDCLLHRNGGGTVICKLHPFNGFAIRILRPSRMHSCGRYLGPNTHGHGRQPGRRGSKMLLCLVCLRQSFSQSVTVFSWSAYKTL